MIGPEYVAVLKCIFSAKDDVEAMLVANRCAELASSYLDADDGEDVKVIEVNSFASSLAIEEQATKLEIARNILLQFGARDAFETARSLDQFVYYLRHNSMANYDYSELFDILERVKQRGNS